MDRSVLDPARIITAAGNASAAGKIKALLAENGYTVTETASDGNELLRKIINLQPDLAIIDHDLPPGNGYETALIAAEDRLCDVILILGPGQRDNIDSIKNSKASPADDIVMIVKPFSKASFISTVELVLKNRRKVLKLEKEIDDLKKSIITRKEVEKAKGLLMAELKISEDAAFRLIQKQSMDRGIPMAEIAAAINKVYGLKRKPAGAL